MRCVILFFAFAVSTRAAFPNRTSLSPPLPADRERETPGPPPRRCALPPSPVRRRPHACMTHRLHSFTRKQTNVVRAYEGRGDTVRVCSLVCGHRCGVPRCVASPLGAAVAVPASSAIASIGVRVVLMRSLARAALSSAAVHAQHRGFHLRHTLCRPRQHATAYHTTSLPFSLCARINGEEGREKLCGRTANTEDTANLLNARVQPRMCGASFS